MDQRSSFAAATALGIAGASMFMIQPGYVQSLVDTAGATAEQAGIVAAVEMTGMALSTLSLSFLPHGLTWQRTIIISASVATIANVLCCWSPGIAALGLLRFMAGFGLGGLTCTAFSAVGETRDPDRGFGFFVAAVLSYGALGLVVLPALMKLAGLPGLYIILGTMSAAPLYVRRFVPLGSRVSSGDEVPRALIGSMARMVALASIFLFFLACGILWAYLALVGTALGIAEQGVATSLGISQFAGVAGALLVAFAVRRSSRAMSLIVALAVCCLATAALEWRIFAFLVGYAFLVSTFNLFWNVAQPLYLSAATDFDPGGGLVERMVALQMCGLALGPFAGALLVGNDGFRNLILVVTVLLFASSVLMIMPFVSEARARTGVPLRS